MYVCLGYMHRGQAVLNTRAEVGHGAAVTVAQTLSGVKGDSRLSESMANVAAMDLIVGEEGPAEYIHPGKKYIKSHFPIV